MIMHRLFWALLTIVGVATPAFSESPGNVRLKIAEKQIDFLIGDELVGRYNIGPEVAKPYFWPLHGPSGVAMTRPWPMVPDAPGATKDHVHQKSAWFCHGDVIPEGLTLTEKVKGVEGVDFWAESKGHGKIVNTFVSKPIFKKGYARIATSTEWRASSGDKVLDELRTISLHDLGNQTRLFVFDIQLTATTVPVTFGDTKEGSFGIRVNDQMRESAKGGKLENAEGKTGEKSCWGFTSPWCDYSGKIDGKEVGIAILADPKNPYPSCWHSRGYGLMAANPFGRAKSGFPEMKGKTDLVKLAKGESLRFRYGLLIHPGDAKAGKVAECFDTFVKLPAVNPPTKP